MAASKGDRRGQILDAAQRIAEAEGLEALTMRRLCSELGLSAPIVYRLYANKAAIIEGLVGRLLGTEALAHEPGTPVGPWLRETFLMVRREQVKHPELLALMADTEELIDKGMLLCDQVIGALRDAGLSAERAGAGFQVLMAYTIGTVLIARGSISGGATLMRMLAKYPRVLESGPQLDSSSEGVFAQGLDLLIAGLGLNDT